MIQFDPKTGNTRKIRRVGGERRKLGDDPRISIRSCLEEIRLTTWNPMKPYETLWNPMKNGFSPHHLVKDFFHQPLGRINMNCIVRPRLIFIVSIIDIWQRHAVLRAQKMPGHLLWKFQQVAHRCRQNSSVPRTPLQSPCAQKSTQHYDCGNYHQLCNWWTDVDKKPCNQDGFGVKILLTPWVSFKYDFTKDLALTASWFHDGVRI